MLSQRLVAAVAIAGPGEVYIMGQLGDGTADEDGQILDPQWLCIAASTWRWHTGGMMPPDGIADQVWQDGDVTRVRGRVFGARAAALAAKGTTAAFSLGIAWPVITRDPAAPMGRITGGVISEISLGGSLFQPELDIFTMLANQLENVRGQA
jgi:hypothetical protein